MMRCLLLILCMLTGQAMAGNGIPLGEKSIYLKDNDGADRLIGRVTFSANENGNVAYDLQVETERFKDFFLSMKEMKCFEGKEIWCFIPYPYAHPKTVSADDLRWLEHDLLFMFKALNAFGANLWNGIYYDMTVEEGMIKGTAKAVDLNYIAGPPDDLTTPPYGQYDVGGLEASSRWLPFIEIR